MKGLGERWETEVGEREKHTKIEVRQMIKLWKYSVLDKHRQSCYEYSYLKQWRNGIGLFLTFITEVLMPIVPTSLGDRRVVSVAGS